MWKLISQIFPGTAETCQLCRAPATEVGLCNACAMQLPRPPLACLRCGLPIDDPHASLCGECIAAPPDFDSAAIPFLYTTPLDYLVTRLKYQGELSIGRLLAEQLASAVEQHGIELLLPMPLHPKRLRARGFNQAAELCRIVSLRTGIPWDPYSLVRTREGQPQRESSRRERQRNVRGAFAWKDRQDCPGRVALVDDVVTTGATARAAASCLKKAGAQWVEIWAVARTPKGRRA